VNYITLTDLTARFGQAELDGLGASVDIARCIADANALADSYVGAVYPLPLATVPAALVGPVCDIARYYAWINDPPEIVSKRYTAAVAFLRDVAKHIVDLGIPPPTDPETGEPADDAGVWFTAEERLFTRKSLAGL
jgi:phage gp36-like protein